MEIDRLLREAFIERAAADLEISIAISLKKNSSFGFYLNYRTLDAMKIHGSYLPPIMNKCFDWVCYNSIYNTSETY